MRLNLTRLRTSGAARRSALRAPSALRAAARRSFVTNMKIEPYFCEERARSGRVVADKLLSERHAESRYSGRWECFSGQC